MENNNKKLIKIAKKYYKKMKKNYDHNIHHIYDVLDNVNYLYDHMDLELDYDCLLISSYWHDVGRVKIGKGHEKLSADMLKEEMIKRNYDLEFIDKCYKAIENHGWKEEPLNDEGKIIKDADKLAYMGIGRWNECYAHNFISHGIIPRLKGLKENLHFEESKKLFDIRKEEFISFLEGKKELSMLLEELRDA